MRNSYLKRVAAAAALSLAVAGSFAVAQRQDAEPAAAEESFGLETESGITKPFEERELAFGAPGLVGEVKVKVGDVVKKGEVLAQQDISVELAEKKPLEIEASSKVQERYAQADQGVKEKELERKRQLAKTGTASKTEVEEAELAVERAKASVELAVQERDIASAKLVALDTRIALKTLKSPISGEVQAVEIGEGEIAASDSQSRPALVVVQNDPLKIDVHVPVTMVGGLTKGSVLRVRYIDEENGAWREAKVRNVNPVVKKDSQTRLVELEMPNKENRPAGLRVDVKLPERVAAAAAPRNAGDRARAEAGQ